MKETKFYTVKDLMNMGRLSSNGMGLVSISAAKNLNQMTFFKSLHYSIVTPYEENKVVEKTENSKPMEGQMSISDVYPKLKLERK